MQWHYTRSALRVYIYMCWVLYLGGMLYLVKVLYFNWGAVFISKQGII